jgi:hypothetical protein
MAWVPPVIAGIVAQNGGIGQCGEMSDLRQSDGRLGEYDGTMHIRRGPRIRGDDHGSGTWRSTDALIAFRGLN